jgi:hypothetical protein
MENQNRQIGRSAVGQIGKEQRNWFVNPRLAQSEALRFGLNRVNGNLRASLCASLFP